MNNNIDDNCIDDHVDVEIQKCLNLKNPKCFFTFAGAGSGKTRSLQAALEYINNTYAGYLLDNSKKVAVITYTNAACDEIIKRVGNNSIFIITTIHSFMWKLIENHQRDIQEWIIENTKQDIIKLEDEENRGRVGTAASIERIRKIGLKKKRLEKLSVSTRFTYNPNGDNYGYDSLNHSEVIKIGANFIETKKHMRNILVNQYPILLIDECQDTKKELIDALLKVNKEKTNFIIGMFGDVMQRIYSDGKENLSSVIPENWVRPQKKMNHRSNKRIVSLANMIRINVDNHAQLSRSDKQEGFIRLFIKNSSEGNKQEYEESVYKRMALLTGDENWLEADKNKRLILEHHMAANRLGFSDFFDPLYSNTSLKDSLIDGRLPEINFFQNIILPLLNANDEKKQLEIMKIVKDNSPLLAKKTLQNTGENQYARIKEVNKIMKELFEMFNKVEIDVTCFDIINFIEEKQLFIIPDRLIGLSNFEEKDMDDNQTLKCLKKAFDAPFEQLKTYISYINGETSFDTHQGVKGLEFPRVSVILDDDQARGFMFSYEKLFGAKSKSERDLKNEEQGIDSAVSRTNRLFYVACTRAEESLAIICYTQNSLKVKENVLANNWFSENEIIMD